MALTGCNSRSLVAALTEICLSCVYLDTPHHRNKGTTGSPDLNLPDDHHRFRHVLFLQWPFLSSLIISLEQDMCGGGASGRNGGFVMSWWPKINSLCTLCGSAQAIQLARAAVSAISEIDDYFFQQHNIDAHLKNNDWIWIATTEAQIDAWQRMEVLRHFLM